MILKRIKHVLITRPLENRETKVSRFTSEFFTYVSAKYNGRSSK